MQKLLFPIVGILLLISACSKDGEEDIDEGINANCRLTSYELRVSTALYRYDYNYNPSGRLESLEYNVTFDDKDDHVFTTATFSYDTEGRINRIDQDETAFLTFQYTDSSTIIDRTVDGRTFVEEFFFNEEGQLTFRDAAFDYRYEYNDLGQLVRIYRQRGSEMPLWREYEYDSNPNPLEPLKFLVSLSNISENITTVFHAHTTIGANNQIVERRSGGEDRIFEFTYNEYDYPLTKVQVGGDISETYEYEHFE